MIEAEGGFYSSLDDENNTVIIHSGDLSSQFKAGFGPL